MKKLIVSVLLLTVVGCHGSSPIVAAAVAELDQDYINDQLGRIGRLMHLIRDLPATVVDPAAAAAKGIRFEPDPDLNAPPFTFLITIPLDADMDGTDDGTFQGKATLSSDPDGGIALPISVDLTFTIEINNGKGIDLTATGTLHTTFAATEREMWGSFSYVDRQNSREGDVDIDQAAPLVSHRPPEGTQGNLCALDVQGDVHVTTQPLGSRIAQALPPGFYQAVLQFLFGSSSLRVVQRSHVLDDGTEEPLDDTTVPLPGCGLQGWLGTWTFDWFCTGIPDAGQDVLQITQAGPNKIRISDGTLQYEATVQGSPNIVSGSFTDTDDGGTYVEDFTWTLAADGRTWKQVSHFRYISGPLAGGEGDCFGTARR